MLADLKLPDGVELARSTPEFTAETVPDGLKRAHLVAAETWGVLRVSKGSVRFVLEATADSRTVDAGQTQVIEPQVAHRVEPSDDAVFVVEFHH